MPLVQVRFGGPEVDEAAYKNLLEINEALASYVADALHVKSNPAAHLTPDDIEIDIEKFPVVRKNRKNVEIRIEAMTFPERVANKRERCVQLLQDVRRILPSHLSVSIWLVLVEAEYIESLQA